MYIAVHVHHSCTLIHINQIGCNIVMPTSEIMCNISRIVLIHCTRFEVNGLDAYQHETYSFLQCKCNVQEGSRHSYYILHGSDKHQGMDCARVKKKFVYDSNKMSLAKFVKPLSKLGATAFYHLVT